MEPILAEIFSRKKLAASRLASDPRIAQAKRLLLQAVDEHQKGLDHVRPPDPELKLPYEKLIEAFESCRGGKLWYPYIGSGIGNGPFVELLDGSVKYDFISGIGVHYWGHSHPDIIESSIDAALSNTIMQGHLQQNADALRFSQLLLSHAKLDHCFLTTSGAMANENALKIAFQKRHPANRLLAFEKNFAGRTLAISQITDKPAYREGLPPMLEVDYLPFYDPKDPEGSTARALKQLKGHLEAHPGKHAAMLFELVQGEAGARPGSRAFFKALMTPLKEEGIAIIDDEVQAFGRTPELFAFRYFGLEEFVDIVTVGKLSQVCATLFKNSWQPKPGLLSQTFTGAAAVIRAGEVIVRTLVEEGYFGEEGKIAAFHRFFKGKLEKIAERTGKIEGPFGIGSMVAFTPYGGEHKKVMELTHRLFEAGLITFIAGADPARVRMLLPVGAITEKEIENVCSIIEGNL